MVDPAQFCRDIETYLCQKNEGHLIRIVGPAFEQVCGWADRGVPLKVAFRGIDRYFERYYAKAPGDGLFASNSVKRTFSMLSTIGGGR